MATPNESNVNPFDSTPPLQPKGKEKKRVGFHEGNGTPLRDQTLSRPGSSGGAGSAGGSGSAGGTGSALRNYSPAVDDRSSHDGVDHDELTRALSKILMDDKQQPLASPGEQPSTVQAQPQAGPSSQPQMPVVTEPAPPYFPPARQQQQEKSEKAARDRADRLAQSVERDYSNPASRAHSIDGDGESDDTIGNDGILSAFRRRRRASNANRNSETVHEPLNEEDEDDRPAPDPHTTALQLVQSHARGGLPRPSFLSEDMSKEPSNPFQYDASLATQSGYSTPTNPYDNEVREYIPPPNKYNGGVLSSLLRLYNNPSASGSNSVANSEQSTPTGTPSHSRPPSPGPGDGTETPRRRSGFFGKKSGKDGDGTHTPKGKGQPWSVWHPNHKHTSSTTSLSAGLLGTSSILASAGSADIGQAVTERVKRERPTLKRNQNSGSSIFGVNSPKFKDKEKKSSSGGKRKRREDEQMRITKHIAQVLSRHRYITTLCRALMMYGAPTHRLEDYLKMSARVLEIEAQFLFIPGCMLVSFDDSSTHTAEVKLVRAPQGVDLGKLSDVHVIYKEVIHDLIGVDEAIQRLNDTMKKKSKYKNWLRIPVYGLASVSVAPFAFGGRFIDLPIAFILGCIVGLMALVAAPSNAMYSNVFEISAAVITSFLARAMGSINDGKIFCFSALAQSSIALILPGYMVLCASLELQSQNIVAGSVRMVYAMIYTLFLGYGITIGTAVYGAFDSNAVSTTTCTDPLSRPWYFLFVPMFTLCLCIINQAKIRQMPIMLLISVGGFAVNTYASSYFSSNAQISNTLGALTIGVMANLYARTLPFFDRHFRYVWANYLERHFGYFTRNRPRKQWSSVRSMPPGSAQGSPGVNKEGNDYFDLPTYRTDPEHRAEEGNNLTQEQQDAAAVAAEKKAPGSSEVMGYGLAAAAMLPAIFVQVPSGLAVNGSLLSGINAADELTGNSTSVTGGSGGSVNNVAFTVLLSVIQVAIGITVGLFFSALIVYPLGKRRSALFSF
ncbi:pheromone-regulated membrane protein [Ophiostoma piceae UAMH 11346]|uniref:Pheromone-regulated membrane protein n=1 Tax=Ophiostoma piceae (strain UAMH 11346) TaxID=1262450 RepID=S3CAG2_OPHP1|nr:pheromone-regulated membrane protein [Ophiostoma piceae UAMH 11346]